MQNTKILFLDGGNHVEIGNGCQFGSNCKIVSGEGKKIIIQNGCLFSYDIEIRNTDSHSIYSNGVRINTAEDVIVKDNVWVAQKVLITKGAIVEHGCVIGAKALYGRNTDSESNCMYAGIPARKIKNNISWNIRRDF